MINALRGMKDLLEKNAKTYEYCIYHASKIAKNYGFSFIQTPLLEETALFKRSVGESSDIVGKEMYQFIDKGDNDVCLRPEGTAGVVRAFVQNKLDRTLANYRFFYHGNMFRYERPQKGRLRQFHQFGVESFGENDVKEDATIILLANEILEFFKIKTTLKINSLGCPKCMPPYKKNLIKFLDETKGLCGDCERRKLTNPIRVLDCKNEKCFDMLKNAPRLLNNLCPTCKEEFQTLQNLLTSCNIKFQVDTNLVRGLDYYSKTAFEFVSSDLGSQGAIIGGGRYDKLVEYLGGKPTAGVGFAMGIERVMELINIDESQREGYYFGGLNEDGLNLLFALAKDTRKDKKVYLDYQTRSLKAHLKQADKKGALWCVCVGEDELKNNTLWIKNLQTKDEKNLLLDEFRKI